MSRVTRAHTIRRHLVDGGLTDLQLTEAEQQNGPDGHDTDGFAVRQQYNESGTLVVVAGAYGPNWLRTLAEISGRLEERHIRCMVIAEAPGVADHEVMVRWATSAELQARAATREARQASLKAQLRQAAAQQRAAEERQAIEDAGQSGLFDTNDGGRAGGVSDGGHDEPSEPGRNAVKDETAVRVTIPAVPDGADVHRSWRRVLAGLDERADGDAAVLGPEVGHGAVVETTPGALVLVVDQHITGWGQTYYDGKSYPLMDAAVSLHLVQDDGALKALWARHFKTAKGAFGTAGRGQIRKHLQAHPPADEVPVRVIDPGPGRPNIKPGPCRWCSAQLPKGAGVLVGRGEDAQVEHRKACPTRPAEPGTYCALCGVSVAPGAARLVVVREGEGRREVQHTGQCEGQKSFFVYEREQAERRAAEEARRAEEKAEEAKRAQRREAAAEKRRLAREAKAKAAREAAEATRARVESLTVVEETGRRELYDKGLSPRGERMRLVEITAVLSDGAPATWWEVTAYGGYAEDDDRGGQFFLLADARAEYQRYEWQPEPYRPRRRPRVGAVPCPDDGAKHCDHCGSTVSAGGWMLASFGRACDTDCYDAMSNDPGAHARQYHH